MMNLPGSCKAVCWKSHVLSCSCLLGQGRSVPPSWWRYIRACPAWKERNLSMTVAGARMAGEDGNCNAAFLAHSIFPYPIFNPGYAMHRPIEMPECISGIAQPHLLLGLPG